MVEYFGEQFDGFVFIRSGWVQSYGLCCVKLLVIYGDVICFQLMMVCWLQYVQLFIDWLMKGMLIGLVMVLQWLFVCDDQLCVVICWQIVLVLCDEVLDLEVVGIGVIQIDELVICEGLLLCCVQWCEYLDWVVEVFWISVSGVCDVMQIYIYMCYFEFNDIIYLVVVMDVDVIFIEILWLCMELLDVFVCFQYFNEIGLGVYDIYLLCVLDKEEMFVLLCKVVEVLCLEQIWVNLDCGFKICGWKEICVVFDVLVVVVCQLCEESVDVNVV